MDHFFYKYSNMRSFLIFSLLKYSLPRFGLYCNILLFGNNLLYFIISDVGFMHPKIAYFRAQIYIYHHDINKLWKSLFTMV